LAFIGASPQTQSCANLETSRLWQQQERLIYEITKLRKVEYSDNLIVASGWYISYLESKVRYSWGTLFAPVLLNINSHTAYPSIRDIEFAFSLFSRLVVLFRDRKRLALVDIVDTLYNNRLLKETDDDRSAAAQLVFATLGWISTLGLLRISKLYIC